MIWNNLKFRFEGLLWSVLPDVFKDRLTNGTPVSSSPNGGRSRAGGVEPNRKWTFNGSRVEQFLLLSVWPRYTLVLFNYFFKYKSSGWILKSVYKVTVSFKLNFIYTASLIQPRREIQTKATKKRLKNLKGVKITTKWYVCVIKMRLKETVTLQCRFLHI